MTTLTDALLLALVLVLSPFLQRRFVAGELLQAWRMIDK